MKITNPFARLTEADLAEASRRKAAEFSQRMIWLRQKFGHLLRPRIHKSEEKSR